MDVLVVTHHDDVGPGVLEPLILERGHRLEVASLAADQPPKARPTDYGAVLILGGRMQVDQEERHPWLRPEKEFLSELVEARVPVFGICLGAQLLADVRGGVVGPVDRFERGWLHVELDDAARDDPVFGDLPDRFMPLVWHSYEFKLPPGARPLAHRPSTLQAFRLDDAPAWGVQFHLEPKGETVQEWIREAATLGIGHESRVDEAEQSRLEADTRRLSEPANGIARQLGNAFLQLAEERR
jgi:GMP synthase (glutamine-hydrolysing)